MTSTPFQIPKMVPTQIFRPTDAGIPAQAEDRRLIKEWAGDYINRVKLTPPMPMEELRIHADALLAERNLPEVYRNFVAVIINNRMWEETLAAVPYERRLLLMPKCLRKESVCPAPFDEFGLLCKRCGQCSLQDLQEEAERLGYAVLIAEGSTLVMRIIETGKIDAIVGVSCLSVLEKAFPYMEAAAIPGVAIPLLQGDCIDTNVDLDWVWDVIHLTGEDKTRRLNLDALKSEVQSWFSMEMLDRHLGPSGGEADKIARRWLHANGKRWRPFLAACVYKALQEDQDAAIPEGFIKLAIGVECFHKASLVHDDIEDDDDLRYGAKTLHAQHGVPIALNVGDLLIGEGYRLIAECGAADLAKMVHVAAVGQRDLCLGQGAELDWLQHPQPLKTTEVLEIFAKKTAPAFEVALCLGAAYAGCGRDVQDLLRRYSHSLGIAYQIHDDLADADHDEDPNDVEALRPSVLLAYAFQKADGEDKRVLEQIWRRQPPEGDLTQMVNGLYEKLEVRRRVENLRDSYKEQAVEVLRDLDNANLKGLLRRVIGKIFNEIEIKEWCSEFETRNAASREAVAPIVV